MRQTTAIDDRSERSALAYNDLPCSSSRVKKCILDSVIRQNDIYDHVAFIATFKKEVTHSRWNFTSLLVVGFVDDDSNVNLSYLEA